MRNNRASTVRITLVASVVVGSVLAGCGSSSTSSASSSGSGAASGGKHYTIAFSHPYSTAPVAIAVMQFAQERAKQLGDKVLLDNANMQVATQVTDVDNWITQQVDAIEVLPVENASVVSSQKRAQAAGIKWLTYAVGMDSSDGAVLFPPEQSGQLIGEAAVKWINAQPTPPEILVLTQSTVPATAGRVTVPIAMIKKQTKAKIVATQDASDQQTGLTVTEAVLAAHPKLSMVIGFNDDGALGALKAFANANKNPATSWIGGQDGSIEALKAIQAGGAYKMTSALRLKDVGYAVVDTAVAALKGDKAKATANVPAVPITQDDKAELSALIKAYSAAK
jgi:ABC-type sugar transport system substrate-binding protein